jgi:hypothetical protein
MTQRIVKQSTSVAAIACCAVLIALFGSPAVSAAQPSRSGPTPTKPPMPYALPHGATVVRTAAGLTRALAAPGPRSIVLADGIYDGSQPFENRRGDRIYAQHLRKAILTAGMIVGGDGAGGARLQGLAFNLNDPSKAADNGIVYAWGRSADDLEVLDCAFYGNRRIDVGLYALNPQGLDAERLIFIGFTGVALRASNNIPVAYHAPTPTLDRIADIRINGVSRPSPGSSNGTAEAGLWIGHPVRNGVQRIRVRNVSLSGIETVNDSWDTRFSDLDVDMSGSSALSSVGIYMEHMSLHDTFANFRIAGARFGFNGEWNYGTPGDAAAHNTTIKDGLIDASGWHGTGGTVGVNLDEGTESTSVSNVAFRRQSFAGIVAYRNEGTNRFNDNTFALAKGAQAVTPDHV